MTEDPPSIWGMDRAAIAQTLIDGRSPRREYTARDKVAIQALLDRPDFEMMTAQEREAAFFRVHAESTGQSTIESSTGAGSSAVGWALIVAASLLCLYATMGYNVSVHNDMTYVGGSFIPSSDTLNIGLLQNQLMMFQAGLVGILSGVILIAANVARAK